MSVSLPLVNDVSVYEEEPSRILRHQYTMLIQSIKTFRKRWMQEYLTSLQARHYNCCVIDASHRVKGGDLILLKHFDAARYTCPLARIIEVYPDEKGVIRSVLVRCKGEEYLRSIEHIVPLELHCENQRGGNAAAADDVTHASSFSDGASNQREEEEQELPPPSQRSQSVAPTCESYATNREEKETGATSHVGGRRRRRRQTSWQQWLGLTHPRQLASRERGGGGGESSHYHR